MSSEEPSEWDLSVMTKYQHVSLCTLLVDCRETIESQMIRQERAKLPR